MFNPFEWFGTSQDVPPKTDAAGRLVHPFKVAGTNSIPGLLILVFAGISFFVGDDLLTSKPASGWMALLGVCLIVVACGHAYVGVRVSKQLADRVFGLMLLILLVVLILWFVKGR